MDGTLPGIMDGRASQMTHAILIVSIALLALVVVFWFIKGRRSGSAPGGGNVQRLAVVGSTAIDTRRRLVLVRRDDVEHLILIGGPADLVVESAIRPFAHSTAERRERAGSTGSEPYLATAENPPRAAAAATSVEPTLHAPVQPQRAAAEPFAAERFRENPAPAGVAAGNPFGDSDFGAVLEEEMARRDADSDQQQFREPERQPARRDTQSEPTTEEEMARLLADMSRNRR